MKKVFLSLVGERREKKREKERRGRWEREEGEKGVKERGGRWEGKEEEKRTIGVHWLKKCALQYNSIIQYTDFESFSHNKKREREREDGG